MINRFINFTIPLYVVLLIMVLMGGAAIFVTHHFPQTIENYDLFLPTAGSMSQEFRYGSWPALGQSDFFKSVRNKFISEKSSFIEADLLGKRLTVFQDGVAALTVPILATGKAGSWWETPAGVYKIDTKEKNHYSSFAGVYMPWSLPFQGNFFIHGWPYYADGTPVQSTYSGGCIRLSTEDAKTIYDLATPGMPVLVYRGETAPDTTQYTVRPPDVSAQKFLVADLLSNFVLAERGSKDVAAIASVTKLVTALTATEYINLETPITITRTMLATTTKPRLWTGEEVKAFNLMYPLLLESSNEAAETYAQVVGRERFVTLMNDKARALGLLNTHFVDPSGSGEGNVSTAEDLFALLKYLYSNQSFFLKVSSGALNKDLGTPSLLKGLENFNGFSGDPEFVGGKVGQNTAAGETMVSVFTILTPAGERPIAIIVLGSANSIADTAALRDYMKTTYAPRS